jgi:hypothetical protein
LTALTETLTKVESSHRPQSAPPENGGKSDPALKRLEPQTPPDPYDTHPIY